MKAEAPLEFHLLGRTARDDHFQLIDVCDTLIL